MYVQELTTTERIRPDYITMSHDLQTEGNLAEDGEELTIESRFGTIHVSKDNALYFPQGLLGLPQNLHFVLADIPRENMGQFKLLQCLNDHTVSFVVLPLDSENSLIEKSDLLECCDTLNVKEDDLLTLLIVSVQRSPEAIKVTANLRAPVIVDVNDKAAIQYVFPTNKYDICHQL